MQDKMGNFNYIEIGGIRGDGTAGSESILHAEAPSRATWYVKAGDVIGLSEKMLANTALTPLEIPEALLPFLAREKVAGKLLRAPKREDVQLLFDTQLIIEYYSR